MQAGTDVNKGAADWRAFQAPTIQYTQVIHHVVDLLLALREREAQRAPEKVK